MKKTDQPFDESEHKHLAQHLPTLCWMVKEYADSIAKAYTGHDNPDKNALADLARRACDIADELLMRMEAASRAQYPDAAWLKEYSASQPPPAWQKEYSRTTTGQPSKEETKQEGTRT